MNLLVADRDGNITDLDSFSPLAQSGVSVRKPQSGELIPMPRGGHLYYLPDRFPLANRKGRPAEAEGLPVAAILPQGYTRTLLPAYGPPDARPPLPYFGYTACFFDNDTICVAAIATQENRKWDPESFPPPVLKKKVSKKLKQNPRNRVLAQLAKCALEYRCYTAANIFFERWEGALPVSPSCNAFCRGCISKAIDEGPPSPQDRFTFVPSFEECAQIVKEHFKVADEPIISFGQGCEGEPSLQFALIEKIILALRKESPRGQFNVNTNGSRPKELERLFRSGLDSIRVSLNSAQPGWYNAYYRPAGYSFDDVCRTIKIAKQYGVFVSLNLLCFPGVTDHPRETEIFFQFLEKCKPEMIQLRNLNIDPWCYLKECIKEDVSGIGMVKWIALMRKQFPRIRIGNHTPYVK